MRWAPSDASPARNAPRSAGDHAMTSLRHQPSPAPLQGHTDPARRPPGREVDAAPPSRSRARTWTMNPTHGLCLVHRETPRQMQQVATGGISWGAVQSGELTAPAPIELSADLATHRPWGAEERLPPRNAAAGPAVGPWRRPGPPRFAPAPAAGAGAGASSSSPHAARARLRHLRSARWTLMVAPPPAQAFARFRGGQHASASRTHEVLPGEHPAGTRPCRQPCRLRSARSQENDRMPIRPAPVHRPFSCSPGRTVEDGWRTPASWRASSKREH